MKKTNYNVKLYEIIITAS